MGIERFELGGSSGNFDIEMGFGLVSWDSHSKNVNSVIGPTLSSKWVSELANWDSHNQNVNSVTGPIQLVKSAMSRWDSQGGTGWGFHPLSGLSPSASTHNERV